MGQYTSINQEDYDQIKLLHSAGMSNTSIHRFTKRARWTIQNIIRSSSLEDYRVNQREYMKRYKSDNTKTTGLEVVTEEQIMPPTENDSEGSRDATETTNDIVVQLERIATAMERLATAREATDTKKRRFL